MRGSLNSQIMAALKCITRIGASRHQAKQDHGGKSPFIHSVGTLDKTFQRLRPLAKWLKKQGVRDLEKINEDMVAGYLNSRLSHHLFNDHSRQTFKVELSALASLERALKTFQQLHRDEPQGFDFQWVRMDFSKHSRILFDRTSEYRDRAARDTPAVIAAIEDNKHRLMARLQVEAGCRAEGVGAPRRGSNPFTTKNFHDPETGAEFETVINPASGKQMAQLWTIEKGGKLSFKLCSIGLKQDILRFFKTTAPCLKENYPVYLAAVNRALGKTRQGGKGTGTHSLRFAFARRRYAECLAKGLGDEQAKQKVSHEMSHNRPDITGAYL